MEALKARFNTRHKMSRAISADRFCFRKSWGGAPGYKVDARLWRQWKVPFLAPAKLKEALQSE